MSAQGCQRSRASAGMWRHRFSLTGGLALATLLVFLAPAPALAAVITWDGGGTNGTCGGGAVDVNTSETFFNVKIDKPGTAAAATDGTNVDLGRGKREGLERLNLEASDRTEVFDVPSQERGVAEQRGGRDEGIRDRDGGAPSQLGSVPGDAGRDRHAWQQVQQLTNLSLIARSQRRSGQGFTLGDDRDGGAHATTLNISVDEDVGVDEVLHELRRLTPETVFPSLSKLVLEGSAWRDTAAEESSRFRHNAVATQNTDAADRVNRFHRPLEGLQLVFQTFQLLHDVCRFHRLSLLVRSVA